jgi:hypothetical protein
MVTQREVRVFSSFADADEADDEAYAALSPAERVDVLLELIAAHREGAGEATSRFERIYRVTDLSRLVVTSSWSAVTPSPTTATAGRSGRDQQGRAQHGARWQVPLRR